MTRRILAALLAATPLVAHGATVVHEVATQSTTDGNDYTTASFTSNSGELLFIFSGHAATADTGAVATCSDGQTFHAIGRVAQGSGGSSLYAFVGNALVGSSSSITCNVNLPSDPATGGMVFVASVSGMSLTGSAAVKQSGSDVDRAASGTPAVTMGAALTTTNPSFLFTVNNDNPAAITFPTGWEGNGAVLSHNTPTKGSEYSFRDSGSTATTITWGGTTGSTASSYAVELDASASCAGTPAITDVATDESFPANQTNVVITGTNFCAAQGAGGVTLRQSGNSKTLSIDSWSDTSVQVDISGAGMGVVSGLLYGGADIRLTNDATNFDDQAVTLEAPSGTEYVDIGTLLGLTFDGYGNESRVHGGSAALDPTAASQCAWRNVAGLSNADINSDGSITVTGTGSFDHDCTDNSGSGGSELYVASYGSHPNCPSGSTIVCPHTLLGTPPLFGATPIGDHVLAVGLAMTSYDVDDYFLAGEAASSARALRQLGATTDTTANLVGAHTGAQELTVSDVLAHASLVKGAWMRIGAGGAPVRIRYIDPVNNKIGLWESRDGSNNDDIITYATGAGSVSNVTVNSGSGVVSGTPNVDATTTSLLYRWTDAAGLIAENLAVFEIDVITVTDETANTLSGAVTDLTPLGVGISSAGVCSSAEGINQILTQNSTSVLWGTTVQLTFVSTCGTKVRRIRTRDRAPKVLH